MNEGEEGRYTRIMALLDISYGLPRLCQVMKLAGCDNDQICALYIRCRNDSRKDKIIKATNEYTAFEALHQGKMTRPHAPLTQVLIRESMIFEDEYNYDDSTLHGRCITVYDILLEYERFKMQVEAKELLKIKSKVNLSLWSSALQQELNRLEQGDIDEIREFAIYGPAPNGVEFLKIRLGVIGLSRRKKVLHLFSERIHPEEKAAIFDQCQKEIAKDSIIQVLDEANSNFCRVDRNVRYEEKEMRVMARQVYQKENESLARQFFNYSKDSRIGIIMSLFEKMTNCERVEVAQLWVL